jgi:hypothetical protein
MIAIEVQHYLNRARDFYEGMRLLKDDIGEFRFSSALLGIHCAISYCDALRVGLGSPKVSSDDHRKAAADLKSRLLKRRFSDLGGIHQLASLLSEKSSVSYSSNELRRQDAEVIVQQTERFMAWAEAVGKKLKVQGW